MSRILFAVGCIAFLSAPALGQSSTFEAASVKPGTPVHAPAGSQQKSTGARRTEDPGRITFQNTTPMDVLMRAYEAKRRQISGPAWLSTETYDIAATLPNGASTEQIPAMLRNLLMERFKMTVRVENRQEHIYALTPGKNPQLKESKDPETSLSFDREGHMNFVGYTLPAFAGVLTNVLDREVIDSTGLTGLYDFSIPLNIGRTPPDPASAETAEPEPSVFSAIQDIGLKLEVRDGTVKHIVIDKADKVPAAN